MTRQTLRLLVGALVVVCTAMQACADAILRTWAESGNEYPVRLVVQGARSNLPGNTISTIRFTVVNPQPRRVLHLQAVATYETDDGGGQVTSRSNLLSLEVDQTARDCRLFFFVINGYALAGSLSIGGRECHLLNHSASFMVPVGDLPAGTVLKGQVSIFAQ